MKTCAILCTIAVSLCLLFSSALSDVPMFINYQGNLTDSDGNPVDGSRHMRFYIYPDSTGVTELWNEQHNDVPIDDGLFQVILGASIPLPSSIFDGTTKWITAVIYPDGSELSPRQPLVTVPYSFKTTKSDSASFADWADYADDASYSDEAGYADVASLANNANHSTYSDTASYSLVSAPDGDWTISGDHHLSSDWRCRDRNSTFSRCQITRGWWYKRHLS